MKLTINNFINQYQKKLSSALAAKFELDAEEVFKFMKAFDLNEDDSSKSDSSKPTLAKASKKDQKVKPSPKAKSTSAKSASGSTSDDETEVDDFTPFGSIKTLKQLKKKVSDAVAKDKYYNVDTNRPVMEPKKKRDDFELYDVGLMGEKSSENLVEALRYFPNAVLVVSSLPKSNVSSKSVDEESDVEKPKFTPFGAFDTLASFQNKVEKAKKSDSYLNVNTGRGLKYTEKNAKKYDFYDSHLVGIKNCVELKKAVELVGGELILPPQDEVDDDGSSSVDIDDLEEE